MTETITLDQAVNTSITLFATSVVGFVFADDDLKLKMVITFILSCFIVGISSIYSEKEGKP